MEKKLPGTAAYSEQLAADHELPERGPDIVVEAFLDRHAAFFAAAEDLWISVRDTSEKLSARLLEPRIPTQSPADEHGRTRPGFANLEHGNRELRRRIRQEYTPNPRHVIGETNHRAYAFVRDCPVLDEMYNGHTQTPAFLKAATETLALALQEAIDEVLAENPRPIFSGLEEVSELGRRLKDDYVAAFAGQYFVTLKLRDMLSDDDYTDAALNRLLELAGIGLNGPKEYPGLLEAVATYCATTKNNQENIFFQAIRRVVAENYTKTAFLNDLLQRDPVTWPEKTPRDFIQSAIGAQAVAAVVQSEFDEKGAGATLATRLADTFGQLPDLWQKVYEEQLDSLAANRIAQFQQAFKPYARQGRQPSNVRLPKEDDQRQRTTTKARRRTGKGVATDVRPSEKPLDVQDIASDEQQGTAAPFAVLKSIAGSDRLFSAEHTGDVDALLSHPVISKFLNEHKGEPGLAEAIKAYLLHIARDPFNRLNTVKLKPKRLSVSGGVAAQYSTWLRRYRPQQTVGGERSTRFTDRIRIVYAVGRIDEQNHILIERVTLRDDTTYM